MSTWVIGDLHGCATAFESLLAQIDFEPGRDQLWLTGDLINRGPACVDTLARVYALRDSVQTVLGNHDLHLLGCWAGLRQPRAGDTVDALLAAPAIDDWCQWLRRQPLIRREGAALLVHAGLYPGWSLAENLAAADRLQRALAGAHWRAALAACFAKGAPRHPEQIADERQALAFCAAALTRMRFVDPRSGALVGREKGPPESAHAGAAPWYTLAGERFAALRVFTGHWAALGHRHDHWHTALDGACVWGGELLAADRDTPTRLRRARCAA